MKTYPEYKELSYKDFEKETGIGKWMPPSELNARIQIKMFTDFLIEFQQILSNERAVQRIREGNK